MVRISFLVLALPLLTSISPAVTSAAEKDPVSRAAAAAKQGRYTEAIDTLRDALTASPKDVRILLELGEVSESQARQSLAGPDSTFGELGLADALSWYRKALKIAPHSEKAQAGIGRVAMLLGKPRVAEAAWTGVVKVDPADGEAWYELAQACSQDGRFKDAIQAYDAAERFLGPQPRIRLNRGITEARQGKRSVAEDDFLTLIHSEVDAGRGSSKPMHDALLRLWRLYADTGDYGKAEDVFARLGAAYPDLPAAPWYVGHAFLADGNPNRAAQAFERVTKLLPKWPDGWRQLGETLLRAGEFDRSVSALDEELSLDPAGSTPRSLLLEIAAGMLRDQKFTAGIALLKRMQKVYPDDPQIVEYQGDLRFGNADAKGALADYEAAEKLEPYSHEVEVKAEKAATILLRAGTAPKRYLDERMKLEAERATPSVGGLICDFENTGIYARVNGKVRWSRVRGALHLVRRGSEGEPANFCLTFIPTIDFRPYASVRFRVRGEKGKALILRARDCRDPLKQLSVPCRLVHPKPILLTGKWQTVTVPAHDFAPADGAKDAPVVESRMRGLVFEIGKAVIPHVALTREVFLDDIELVRPDGSTFSLDRFDRASSPEMTFLTSGATMPAKAPVVKPGAPYPPDPSTFVNPVIFGKSFDPSTVHSGTGSYRVRLAEKGQAEVALSLVPGLDLTEANAITFWARGAKGGERLRVGLEDSLDENIWNAWPASAPRGVARYRLLEGWFVLTPHWKRYRIPCANFPDIDFKSFVRIRFIMGSDLGNPVGTTMYIDDIRWE